VLVAAYRLWHFYDPPYTPLAERMLQPPRVLTEENGYFIARGFDAPAGQDPAQAGRRLDTQFAQQYAARERPLGEERTDDEAVRAKERAGYGAPALKPTFGIQDLCKWRETPCLGDIQTKAARDSELARANAELIDRYRQLAAMPRFVDQGSAHSLNPGPRFPEILQISYLSIAQGALALLDGQTQRGLTAFVDDLTLWRRMASPDNPLIDRMVAIHGYARDLLLLAELFDARPELASRSELDPVLADLSESERDFELSLRHEFRLFAHYIEGDDQAHDLMWSSGELCPVLAALVFIPYIRALAVPRPRDSLNHYAELLHSTILFARLPAARKRAELKTFSEANFQRATRFACPLPRGLFNPVGRASAAMLYDAYSQYPLRLDELRALLQLIRLQKRATAQRVSGAQAVSLEEPIYGPGSVSWDEQSSVLSVSGSGFGIARSLKDGKFRARVNQH